MILHATTYPREEQHVRQAEAANRAAQPGMLKRIDGFTDQLFSIHEKAGWTDATEEMARGRFKQGTVKLVPLGTLQARRCDRKHGIDHLTTLWLGSDGHLYEGKIGSLKRLRPRKIQSHSRLEVLHGKLQQAMESALEQVAEQHVRQLVV